MVFYSASSVWCGSMWHFIALAVYGAAVCGVWYFIVLAVYGVAVCGIL